MKIGNVDIKGNVFLAPMAGISNASYMKICEDMGCSYAVTELISAEAIVRKNKKTLDMLNGYDKLTIPVGVQLFGSNPNVLSKAAKIIDDMHIFKVIDINMGCPVPKVVNAKSGSYLLKDIALIKEIVSSVVSSVTVPVTVKIRSGWDNNSINAIEVAKVCEEAGASAICVHPRTRSQGYSGFSDWSIIKQVKDSVKIPVIGNGDINSPVDAEKMISETGCDAVMIGRACMGNPWIIRDTIHYLKTGALLDKVSNSERIDMCLKHFDLLLDVKSEKQAVLEMRSHIAWYLKGIDGAKEIKNEIFKLKDKESIKKMLLDFKKVC